MLDHLPSMKYLAKIIAVAVPLALGMAAAVWTSLPLWLDMKEGLIAFLGFLAAALVHVMPLTANFLQSDRLSPVEAERLIASLTRQQHYWIGLLTATIVTMVVVIAASALKDRVGTWGPVFLHSTFVNISWADFVVFLLVTSLTFVLIKMLGLFEGMLSLHHLRAELVRQRANREAAERIAEMNREGVPVVSVVPDDYGKVIQTH